MANNSESDAAGNNSSTISHSNSYDDPYFISNGDNLANQLVSKPFNGGNFLNWNRGVKRSLAAKNKIGFITGSLAKPGDSSPDYQKWLRCDLTVAMWILNSIEAELSDEYYGRMKQIWEDIQNIEGFPECSCGVLKQCTCNLLKKVVDADNKRMLIQLLMGLDMSYDHVRSVLLAQDPLTSINHAFSQMLQAERQRKLTGSGQFLDMMYKNKQRGKGSNSHNTKFAANVVDDSSQLSDPLDNTPTNKHNVVLDDAFIEAVAQKLYHNFQLPQQTVATTHTANLANFTGITSTFSVNKIDAHSNFSTWIVEIGATDHMSPWISLFEDLKTLASPIQIGLPDGRIKLVHQVGKIRLDKHIVLQIGLFVPNFRHNLISVEKLIAQNGLSYLSQDELHYSHETPCYTIAKVELARCLRNKSCIKPESNYETPLL
ncbi:hypothetical protein RND81_13G086700 [Saponaria officinalis]|uniref:Retrotransposon Copia-like N-terminal domain-containing protein n=1 Tax=Saponaria officinalis TaxID=3572 RepID=A0AAW1GVB6_SAPOF